jgi:hypothetical protein
MIALGGYAYHSDPCLGGDFLCLKSAQQPNTRQGKTTHR